MPRKAGHTAYETVISMRKVSKNYIFGSSQGRFSQETFISDHLGRHIHEDALWHHIQCLVKIVAKVGYQHKIVDCRKIR